MTRFAIAVRRVISSPPMTWSTSFIIASMPCAATWTLSFLTMVLNEVLSIPAFLWKSLSVAPGSSAETVTPVPRSSSRSDSASEKPKAFDGP